MRRERRREREEEEEGEEEWLIWKEVKWIVECLRDFRHKEIAMGKYIERKTIYKGHAK